MAVDAKDLPPIDQDSWGQYQQNKLEAYAAQKMAAPAPAPAEAPEPEAPTAVDAKASEPEPKSSELPSWVPEPVKAALAAVAPPAPAKAPVFRNGYYVDPDFETNIQRYGDEIGKYLGPSAGQFAMAQARLETGSGQQMSTPYNYGNVGNTDENPRGGGRYAGPEEAAHAWVRFITNEGNNRPGANRYYDFTQAAKDGADVGTLATLIKKAGYATDPNYVGKIVSIATGKPATISPQAAQLADGLPAVDQGSATQAQEQSLGDYANQKIVDLGQQITDAANAGKGALAAAPQTFAEYAGQKLTDFMGAVKPGEPQQQPQTSDAASGAVPPVDSGLQAQLEAASGLPAEVVSQSTGPDGAPTPAAAGDQPDWRTKLSKSILDTIYSLVPGARPATSALDAIQNAAAQAGAPPAPDLSGQQSAADYAAKLAEATQHQKLVVPGLGIYSPEVVPPTPPEADAAAPSGTIREARGGSDGALAAEVRTSDPGLARIIESATGAPDDAGPAQRIQNVGQTLQRMFLDERAPINAIGPRSEAAAATYAGRAGSASQRVSEALGPVYDTLGANMGKNDRLLDGLDTYVMLRRYVEVATEKGRPTGGVDATGAPIFLRNGPGGITSTADATAALGRLSDQLGPESMAKVIKADGQRQIAMNELLADKVRSGFLTQATADELQTKYPHYNPVSVIQAIDQHSGPIAGNNLSQVGNTIKRLTEEGSSADQLPAMQSAALALASGHTNIMRNDAIDTIIRESRVPVERALQMTTGVNTNVGSRSFAPAKAYISAAQQQRIADIQNALAGGSIVGKTTRGNLENEIRTIMGTSELAPAVNSIKNVAVTDSDLLKYAPRDSTTFNRSPGAGGSSLAPANYSTTPANVTAGRSAPPANQLATIMAGVKNDPAGKVSVWRNGKRYLADFSSMPDVERSIKAMDSNHVSMVGQIAQILNAPLRAGATTLSLRFQLRNAFFDAIDAYVRQGIKPLGRNGIVSGYLDAARESPAYRDYIAHGGGMSGFVMRQSGLGGLLKENINPGKAAAALEREVRNSGGITVESPGDVLRLAKKFGVDMATLAPIRRVGEIIEQGPRMATYKQALARGVSPQTAAMAGRRVTVDFSRMGSAMREINAIVPFSNAALQGTLNIARTARANPKAWALRMGGLTTAVAGVYAWNRQFQDRYNDVPEYVKASSLVVMLPGGEPNDNGQPGFKSNPYVALPLRELGALPYLITKALEKADGQDPSFGQALGQSLGAVSPVAGEPASAGMGGAVAKEGLQQAAGAGGYDYFRGRPIVSESLLNKPEGVQATPQTSKAVIDLTSMFNRSALANAPIVGGDKSPVRVQRAIEDLTGGLGKTVLEAVDTATGKPSDLPPLVGGVIGGVYRNYGGETEQRMFDQRDQKMAAIGQQYRETLEAMAKNGATVGPPPKTIEGIPLLPPEEADYREYQLQFLAKIMKAAPELNKRLAAMDVSTPARLSARAAALQELTQGADEYAAGQTIKQIGAPAIRQRVMAGQEADPRKLYPQSTYSPVVGAP